jgi:hypothetical protein
MLRPDNSVCGSPDYAKEYDCTTRKSRMGTTCPLNPQYSPRIQRRQYFGQGRGATLASCACDNRVWNKRSKNVDRKPHRAHQVGLVACVGSHPNAIRRGSAHTALLWRRLQDPRALTARA